MKLRLLYWNIWTENQLPKTKRLQHLKDSLIRIIDEYKPDIVCLNEVVRSDDGPGSLENELALIGYQHTYYSAIGPISKNQITGSLMASKIPFKNVEQFIIGRNTTAKNKGFGEHKTTAIRAVIDINESENVELYLVHPINLKPSTTKEHFRQINEIRKHVVMSNNPLQIIGGDFNEPDYYPKSFRSITKDTFHYRTGTLLQPTWRLNASKFSLINANLDKIFWTKNDSLKLQSFKVIKNSASDHRPLVATFDIK